MRLQEFLLQIVETHLTPRLESKSIEHEPYFYHAAFELFRKFS